MARRADHNHEELTELVLKAALDIVEADTYKNLTARRISDRIGYSVGTLYNHFDNIDDIILHLNGQTFDDLASKLENIKLTKNPQQDTLAYVRCYLNFLKDHPELWRMIFEHSLPDGQTPPEWYLKKAEYILSIYERAFIPLFGTSSTASKNATRTLWSGLHGITSLHVSGKLPSITKMSVNQMASMLVQNFISGLEGGEVK